MNYNQIYAIASGAMTIEKLRIDVTANNIANQHTVLNIDGSGYQPAQVVARAYPGGASFEQYLLQIEDPMRTVEVMPQELPPNQVYKPGHPQADNRGYVSYPGINMVDEMTTLLQASRSYEANIKIINTAHTLYLNTLTIGDER